RNEPALALLPGAPGHRNLQVNARDIPPVARAGARHLHYIRMEQVAGGGMFPMLLLNAAEERELVIGAHMQLKWAHARQLSIVDTLGVLAVGFAARLPIALEHRSAAIIKRRELRVAGGRHPQAACDRKPCDQLPLR